MRRAGHLAENPRLRGADAETAVRPDEGSARAGGRMGQKSGKAISPGKQDFSDSRSFWLTIEALACSRARGWPGASDDDPTGGQGAEWKTAKDGIRARGTAFWQEQPAMQKGGRKDE